jgi:hypothetical protein
MNFAVGIALVIFLLFLPGLAAADLPPASPLDAGFQRLYNLDFAGAQREFTAFEQMQPDDPLGPASEAAADVFSELDRLGVLEARFFTQDSAFRSRKKLKPDPLVHEHLLSALQRAETLADKQLARNPRERDSLFARTLVAGLRADYLSLVENRNLAALTLTREATTSAQALLAVCPNCYDAYVATGVSQYLIGALSPPVRWLVRLGGYSGDKEQGIQQLRLAAENGHYLAPFARILLAIAYVREKKPEEARRLLEQLRDQFPANPLFLRELARLEKH